MRTLAVLTTGRQDWGILRPVVRAMRGSTAWETKVLAGGLHLDPTHGETVKLVEAEGPVVRLAGTSGAGATQASAMVDAVAQSLAAMKADALLLIGDRSETAAAALGAAIARVPIVHLHGGEETEGAIDNALRHAITKLAHLHFVSHEDHARRVRQMGEADASVAVVGAPGLDNLHRDDLPDRAALEASLGLSLSSPLVIVTHHPTTLGMDPAAEVHALTAALDEIDATYVITLPNNDAGNEVIRTAQRAWAARSPKRHAIEALGEARYFGLMRIADAMVGNSSSGLIEAPALQLPVVNIGDRQRGRIRGANVIDVAVSPSEITTAVRRALDPAFRTSIARIPGPFGDGRSGPRIRAALDAWTPPSPPRKRFVDRGAT